MNRYALAAILLSPQSMPRFACDRKGSAVDIQRIAFTLVSTVPNRGAWARIASAI
jgi:hypothetical protein